MGEAKRRRTALGDGPIAPEFVEQMELIAQTLDRIFNPGGNKTTGFLLLTFPFGEDPHGKVNFISNGADRKDVVVLMKEIIARFEGQPKTEGHA